jgi:hypothetical protein
MCSGVLAYVSFFSTALFMFKSVLFSPHSALCKQHSKHPFSMQDLSAFLRPDPGSNILLLAQCDCPSGCKTDCPAILTGITDHCTKGCFVFYGLWPSDTKRHLLQPYHTYKISVANTHTRSTVTHLHQPQAWHALHESTPPFYPSRNNNKNGCSRKQSIPVYSQNPDFVHLWEFGN